MLYERLALEVEATLSGLSVVKPAAIRGTSGVEHKFSFVATEGTMTYAFDFYNDLGELDVIRTFIKKMDTGVRTFVVCRSGLVSPKARELSAYYEMEILDSKEAEDFFARNVVRKTVSSRSP